MPTATIAKDYGDTTFVTGMRAYAAIAVMVTHAGGAGLRDLGSIGQHLAELGAQGVTVFFVISGFSVAASAQRGESFSAYLFKRLARIAPLYYGWLFFAIVMSATAIEWQNKYGTTVNTYNIFMHLSFLSWCDYRIACTILGVEWSIPIEVVWYLCIPYLLKQMSNGPRVLLAVAGSLASLAALAVIRRLLPLSAEDSAYALHWSPFPHATGFVMGIAAYRVRQWRHFSAAAGTVAVLIVPVSILAWSCLAGPPSRTVTYLFFTGLSFGLIVFGEQGSRVFRRVFCNRGVLFIGTVSYGIYLSHMPLLRLLPHQQLSHDFHPFVAFALLTTCSLAVSALTYLAIERPFGRLARGLVERQP